jgi:hypothetical protein
MSYPKSIDVSSGQPTAASHYNTLRADAVYMGQNAINAVDLGTLLARYSQNLKITLLDDDRVRVPGSVLSPVMVMIDGYMVQAIGNVDLSLANRPSGAGALYYVFAVRSDGSTTFTLDVNTTETESTGRRRIGGFYWDGSEIIPASIYVEEKRDLLDKIRFEIPAIANGRLTLGSGDPVPTANIDAAGTIYFTPYKGDRIALYGAGGGWKVYIFSEISTTLAGISADKPADVFLYHDGASLALELQEWTSLSARAVALAELDGVKIKSGDPAKRYLGTVLMTGTPGQSADTEGNRLVWNMYNRVLRYMVKTTSAASWTYTVAVWRSIAGNSAYFLKFVRGLNEDPVIFEAGFGVKSPNKLAAGVGIGLDSNQRTDAIQKETMLINDVGHAHAVYVGLPGEGGHSMHWTEYGNTGVVFYGTNSMEDVQQAGIYGYFLA